ncbi:AI-2E family transporter [Candidatus Woesearchaeota archaeon]|nr:AI-2E family transporter [Candidatus Woesearchaeota archaeon]
MVILSFLLIWPFIPSILSAVILAYIFYPLYLKLRKKVKKDWVAALILSIGVVILVILPFLALLNSVANQAVGVYVAAEVYLSDSDQSLGDFYTNFEQRFGFKLDIEGLISQGVDFIVNATKSFLSSLPEKIINFFIFIFLFYYLLKEGEKVSKRVADFLPLKKDIKRKLIKGCNELIHAVVFGTLLTALIQGTVGGVGFVIFGVGSPIFWGFMMAIFALIPMVGTAVIWAPAALFLFGKGLFLANGWMIFRGAGLFVYGFFGISLIDNFVRPKLIGARGSMHPAIVLLGVLGGLKLVGFIGIIIGPIILSLFLAMVKVYSEDYEI